jgi:hypothetical protein
MLVGKAVFRARPTVAIYRDPRWADFDTMPHPEAQGVLGSSSVVTTHDDQLGPHLLALSLQRFMSSPEATTCRETTFEDETSCYASEFEAAYRRLRGRSADVDVAKNYFKLYGELAATWLVGRMRQEYSVDYLDAAGDALSRLGRAALRSVLDALNIPEEPEFHAALLRTLRWLPHGATQGFEDNIVDVINQYLSSRDPDLVELAIRATRCLSVARRKSLLENAQATVTDADIAGLVTEELARP